MYKKLNDRHKHKTAYPQRVQYLDGSYRLSLLLKLITQSHETHLASHLASHSKPTLNDYKKYSCTRYF